LHGDARGIDNVPHSRANCCIGVIAIETGAGLVASG
jgi:hypothetical protein